MVQSRILCFLFLTLSSLIGRTPVWEVINPKYPSDDILVAGFTVRDFGARGDGNSDDTKAFQSALNAMAEAGGGTVFVPEGKYTIRGRLKIPNKVTLRGEWKMPSVSDTMVRGTILQLYAGRGSEDGDSLIILGLSAGIRDMSLWYPEQSATNPIPYPFTIEQGATNNATFKNLTLVNAYQGIKIGPKTNELHYVNNVYGSPLKTGVRYDSTTDIGRLEKISFSPIYWSGSGLPGSPDVEVLRDWLKENANAIHMLRSDWEYVDRVHIEGYQVGFKVTQGQRGAANAQFRRLIIMNCKIALYVEKTNPYGMVFTDCYFDATERGVVLSSLFDSVVLFSDCKIRSRMALESNGDGVVFMEQSEVISGNIELKSGVISMIGSKLLDVRSKIVIGADVSGAVFAGNEFAGGNRSVENRAKPEVVRISSAPVELHEIPEYPISFKNQFVPASDDLKVVMPEGSQNMREPIQKALDDLSHGGGILLLPGEDYVIRGSLNIPTGVELRGVHDVPHHTSAGGSVLHFYPEGNQPSITMEASSGLRGISVNYPKQSIKNVLEYPFLIQGRGSDIYIINVNASNPFRYLDLGTYRNDRHYVEYLSGSPLKVGVLVGGGSVGGQIRNLQFNPHYWSRTPKNNRFYAMKPVGGIMRSTGALLWTYQKENMDAMIFADCDQQFLYQNFVYGSLYGIRFTKDNGNGPRNLLSHGHGTDGSKIGVFFEHGSEQITMVNSELVAMSSEDKIAIKLGEEFEARAVLINSMVWGQPDYLAVVESGILHLQNLHATRYGKGISVENGRMLASNINYLYPSTSHLVAGEEGVGELNGVVLRGELVMNDAAKQWDVDLVVNRPRENP
ncbi:MAG: glycosyl hydrolase family 28-related protein [Verrucomicrobiota bacterium]